MQPFAIDQDYRQLQYVFQNKFLEQPAAAEITKNDETNQIEIHIGKTKINHRAAEKILQDMRHILRLDDDLSEFYRLVGHEKSLRLD